MLVFGTTLTSRVHLGNRRHVFVAKILITTIMCTSLGLLLWNVLEHSLAFSYNKIYHMESNETNQTLGFARMFALSLPSRTDRQDALEIMAEHTDLLIEWVYGPTGNEVEEVTFPLGMTREAYGNGYIGSWRGHLNILRKIIRDRIPTALIIEDDVDWDVRLKSQMKEIHQVIQKVEFASDWDVLWLGSLGEQLPDDDARMYLMHDPTVPNNLQGGFKDLFTKVPNETRIIHPSNLPLTTNAYAVSHSGAKKILYQISLLEVWRGFDSDLATRCRMYLNCISVSPGVFHEFRFRGSKSKDSNNWQHLESGERSKPLISKNVGRSVRKLLDSELTAIMRPDRQRITNTQWEEIWSDESIHQWEPEK